VLALAVTSDWPSLAALEPFLRGHHADLLAWRGERPVQLLCAFCLEFTLISALASGIGLRAGCRRWRCWRVAH
jgi:hypothetical protein